MINQIKTLKHTVQDGLEGLQGTRLQGSLTPSEFLNLIKKEVQEFIYYPKWEEIIGKTPPDRVSVLYNNLTGRIKSYNDSRDGGNKQQMDLDLSAIKEIAREIILNLNSSIDRMEKVGRVVRAEKIKETTKSEGKDKEMPGSGSSINVSAGNQNSVISGKPPVPGTESKTKNLNIRLNSLLYNLGALITQVDNWEKLTKTTKIEFLGSTSTAYVTLVENYQASWLELVTDLSSDYGTVWDKVKDSSDQLITNFEKLIESINDLKNPRHSIMSIRKEVKNGVTTIIEIVGYEARQYGGSN